MVCYGGILDMSVSIIVPVYNRAADLARCLEAITGNDPAPDQVIVVDDGSTDGSDRVAERFGCEVVRSDHRGASFARNLGARTARHELLIFIDSDVEIGARDIGRMVDTLSEEGVCAAFGVFDPAAKVPNLLGDYNNLTQHFVFARKAGETRLCHTSFFGVHKAAFLSAGGFDDDWGKAVADDVVLGLRLLRDGCRTLCRNDIKVKHHKSMTMRGFLRSRFFYGYEWARAAYKYRGQVKGSSLTPPDFVNSMRTPVNVLLCSGFATSLAVGPFGYGVATAMGAGFVLWNQGFLRFVTKERGPGCAALYGLLLVGETALTSTGLIAGVVTAPWPSKERAR